MGRRDEEKAEVASAARDFVMARLLAARGSVAIAAEAIDQVADMFTDPGEDASGNKRKQLLEAIDAALGAAAISAQLAMAEMANIDPEEEEPDPESEDDDEDEEEEDDDESKDEPAKRRRRGAR